MPTETLHHPSLVPPSAGAGELSLQVSLEASAVPASSLESAIFTLKENIVRYFLAHYMIFFSTISYNIFFSLFLTMEDWNT